MLPQRERDRPGRVARVSPTWGLAHIQARADQSEPQADHAHKGPKAASTYGRGLSAADPAHCSTPPAAIAKRSLHEETLPTRAPIKEPSRPAAATTLATADGAAGAEARRGARGWSAQTSFVRVGAALSKWA